jgi:putative sterol carrier protein
MSYEFPSPEWVSAYADAINANDSYKTTGKDWTFGVVAMVVKADPAIGLTDDLAMLLDVHQGTCRGATLVPMTEAESAPFVVVATYPQWKAVIKREIDPTKALMQGKLKLTKGHMPTMVRFVNASKDLVESTSRIETKFKDD